MNILSSHAPKEQLTSSVYGAKDNGTRRVVAARIPVVVVEVERAGARTIVVVPTTEEPGAGRVRKVGAI